MMLYVIYANMIGSPYERHFPRYKKYCCREWKLCCCLRPGFTSHAAASLHSRVGLATQKRGSSQDGCPIDPVENWLYTGVFLHVPVSFFKLCHSCTWQHHATSWEAIHTCWLRNWEGHQWHPMTVVTPFCFFGMPWHADGALTSSVSWWLVQA